MKTLKDELLAAATKHSSEVWDRLEEDEGPKESYIAGATQGPLLEKAIQIIKSMRGCENDERPCDMCQAVADKFLAEIQEARR